MSDHGIGAWTRGFKPSRKLPTDIPYRHTEHEFPEHSTRSGAQALAARITAYWYRKGHYDVVVVACDPFPGPEASAYIHCVRSNLVRGLPPKANRR